jgi:hypothetical protein
MEKYWEKELDFIKKVQKKWKEFFQKIIFSRGNIIIQMNL